MRHFVFASLLTTSIVGAQVTARLESGSTGIRVDACGVKTFPKGKDMGTKFSLSTACSGSTGKASYHATLTAGPYLDIVGSSTPNYTPTQSCSSGPNKVILTWTAPTAVSGFLRVVTNAKGITPHGIGEVKQSVDIGDDGKVEFSASSKGGYSLKSADFPVTIDSKGIRIAIVTSSRVGFHRYVPSVKAIVSVLFLRSKPNCSFTKFGTGCGRTGPQLWASGFDPRGDAILFHGGGLVGGTGLMTVGLKSLNIPLPISGCRQHTDLLILLPVTLGPGVAQIPVRLPAHFKGSARVQFFSYHAPNGVLDIRSSNGLLLTCR